MYGLQDNPYLPSCRDDEGASVVGLTIFDICRGSLVSLMFLSCPAVYGILICFNPGILQVPFSRRMVPPLLETDMAVAYLQEFLSFGGFVNLTNWILAVATYYYNYRKRLEFGFFVCTGTLMFLLGLSTLVGIVCSMPMILIPAASLLLAVFFICSYFLLIPKEEME